MQSPGRMSVKIDGQDIVIANYTVSEDVDDVNQLALVAWKLVLPTIDVKFWYDQALQNVYVPNLLHKSKHRNKT